MASWPATLVAQGLTGAAVQGTVVGADAAPRPTRVSTPAAPGRHSQFLGPPSALDRRDPVLPLSPGRAERHGFEYVRHGTLSLYAALEVGTGHVEGRTAARHTSAEFVAFLDHVVGTQPRRRAIHLICDNLAAHRTPAVRDWLAAHPRVTLHYTPTYSSWLNQVELWFPKIERDCIARGIFTSTGDLRRKLMQYIRAHNKTCRPFRWSYSTPTRRIRASGT